MRKKAAFYGGTLVVSWLSAGQGLAAEQHVYCANAASDGQQLQAAINGSGQG
ncbi:hypothetical protein GCM10011611_24600 [Aliidongia dinghuensis]|uniref:Uncharacterized protein n=1 Tax=Aliidongia dinghuensis TaxID=1867774 RepID=A0A8J3E243_9PROT|nr:hypothetical protein [Aliidongia dinghuensis]GGF17825.1 hypothetical protein GCM10011611_24600 [Aliidongia dinghuensis]